MWCIFEREVIVLTNHNSGQKIISFCGQVTEDKDHESVASKVIKGEISVLSNALCVYFEKVVGFLLAGHFMF